jgi:hypothetical protein
MPCEDFSVHSNQLEEVYDHRNRAVFDTAMLRAIDRVITTVMNLGFNARYHKSLNTCVWFISVFWGDAD